MNAKAIALLACITTTGLIACTTRPDPGRDRQIAGLIPPPGLQFDLPLEQNAPRPQQRAQSCLLKLSTTKSCMELDARAFEPCLVTTRSCNEKGEGGFTPLGEPAVIYSRPQSR